MAEIPPAREQTDDSLRNERINTDHELLKRQEAVAEDADAVLAVARERADEVLQTARAEADALTVGPTVALEVERAKEDRVVAEGRSTEMSQLQSERMERRRAMAALLRFERQETDADLRQERQHADAALGTRDEFLEMVSHDLRGMLNGIALSTSLLMQETPTDARGANVVKRAEGIQRLTFRMSRLIGDLLDVASIDAGRFRVEIEANEVARLIHDSVAAFQPAALVQRISLSADVLMEGLVGQLDHERILQVLANLVSNAIKFTGKEGQITLGAERDGEKIRFTVRDTGAGIPSGHLETIFERFRQVNSEDRRGHGLGLYISKCIVEAHGGNIWVESTLGAGSAFHFTVPAQI